MKRKLGHEPNDTFDIEKYDLKTLNSFISMIEDYEATFACF